MSDRNTDDIHDLHLLESPALCAPKEEWLAWRESLLLISRKDASVGFALKRADQVLLRFEQRKDYRK